RRPTPAPARRTRARPTSSGSTRRGGVGPGGHSGQPRAASARRRTAAPARCGRVNIAMLLEMEADAMAERLAVGGRDDGVTYEDLLDRARKTAAVLAAAG